jgi:hypothetical protein
MTPINYPFYYDGVGYLGVLAAAYNQANLWQGLHAIWSIHPLPGFESPGMIFTTNGPLYLSLQLIALKAIGFSYRNALWVQGCISALLIAANIAALGHSLGAARKHALAKLLLILSTLGALFCIGAFHTLPGNIFDFRIDLVGGLLLTLALTSLNWDNLWTALIVGIAIHERFHNLSILTATLLSLSALQIVLCRIQRRPTLASLLKLWRWPLVGIFFLLILRGEQLQALFHHYATGYFGAEMKERGFVWGTRDFFLYYPYAFIHDFLTTRMFYALPLAVVALLLVQGRLNRSSTKPIPLAPALPLVLASITALALLTVNMNRNNIGVLRFSLLPMVFALSYLLTALLLRSIEQVDDKQFRFVGIFLSLSFLTFFCAFSARAEYRRLRDFNRNFDYLSFRKNDLVSQIDAIFYRIYAETPHRSGMRAPLRMGANFNSDYNFNHLQWNIFVATHSLPWIPYNMTIGWDWATHDSFKSELSEVENLDYFAIAEGDCGTPEVPFNRQVLAVKNDISALATRFCPSVIGSLELTNCRVEVHRCKK